MTSQTSLLQQLTETIQVLQTHDPIKPPQVEVLGLSTDVIQNILPVLFPTVQFVSPVQDLENCLDIDAILSFHGKSICDGEDKYQMHVNQNVLTVSPPSRRALARTPQTKESNGVSASTQVHLRQLLPTIRSFLLEREALLL
jgi:hypothetical protein